jgi:hypothetical protein
MTFTECSILCDQKLPWQRANQSLKLTAEARVQTRGPRENELVVATRRQCWTELRIVRKYSYQRRSLAPVR